MKTVHAARFAVPAALLTLFLTGCTVELWSGPRSYCAPAPNPNLALYEAQSPPDILVEYDAISDRRDQVLRLAYFSAANQKRLAAGHAPRFTNPKRALKLTPVPVIAIAATATNLPSSTNTFATMAGGKTFTLYRPGQKPETCALPFYRDDFNTTARVALTPITLVADASMVGIAAAVIYAYFQAGGPVANGSQQTNNSPP